MRAPTTPSSLKWLINRRARLSGELSQSLKLEAKRASALDAEIIKASEAYMALVQRNEEDILRHQRFVEMTQHAIAATDVLLREHEIPIDSAAIGEIQQHRNQRKTNYNEMTRLIFECLRKANGQHLSTTEVAVYVSTKCAPSMDEFEFSEFKYAVRKRLGHLVWEGRLDRIHLPRTSIEGRWKLLPESDSAAKP